MTHLRLATPAAEATASAVTPRRARPGPGFVSRPTPASRSRLLLDDSGVSAEFATAHICAECSHSCSLKCITVCATVGNNTERTCKVPSRKEQFDAPDEP